MEGPALHSVPRLLQLKPSKRAPGDLDALRADLRTRFLSAASDLDIEQAVLAFLELPRNGKFTKPQLAKELTKLLTKDCVIVRKRDLGELERLIANRPIEFTAAVEASISDEVRRFMEAFPTLPKAKKTRRKLTSDEERRRRLKESKSWYERFRRRRTHRGSAGLIEMEFTVYTFDIPALFPQERPPPSGPCLDDLLKLGHVKMSDDYYCLESLFGFDRHNFPKSLRHTRQGRARLYDIAAVVTCMIALLEQNKWLPDPDRRKRVLTGVISRARDVADPKLAAAIESKLSPFLSNSGNCF